VTFDREASPILGAALAYWERKRGERKMPCRRDIDPAEIPRLLANLQLVEVLEEGRRYRYRLVGTALTDAFGRDYTGRCDDELFAGERESAVLALYRAVYDSRQPMFARNHFAAGEDVRFVENQLCLPLSEDGTSVSIILGVVTFERAAGRVAGLWGKARLLPSAAHLEPVASETLTMAGTHGARSGH
jgi:hypothetical protein